MNLLQSYRKTRNSLVTILAVAGLLSACAEEVIHPPAKALETSLEKLQTIPGFMLGKHEVVDAKLDLVVASKKMQLKVFYPKQGEHFPMLLFSHGNWSDFDKYDNVINHWVSHGYVVVAPYHADGGGMARGIFNSLRFGQLGLIKSRTDDLNLILDHLTELEEAMPELRGKIDSQKVAATGHSFGAFSAQQMKGAAAYDPDEDRWQGASDARVKVVVALSPPGPMFDVITEGSWQNMSGPVLMTTGTWDTNPQFWPNWKLHRMSFDTAREGSQYALVIEGADHYLGNLICRPEREEPPQQDALNILNAVTVAFLDAHLKDDQIAKRFINGNALNELTQEFAVLDRR